MVRSKDMFNDHRKNELESAKKASIKRISYKEKIVSLVRNIEKDKKAFEVLKKIEPQYCFPEFILAIGEAPIYYIEYILKKYSNNDQYSMKNIHRDFLNNILTNKLKENE